MGPAQHPCDAGDLPPQGLPPLPGARDQAWPHLYAGVRWCDHHGGWVPLAGIPLQVARSEVLCRPWWRSGFVGCRAGDWLVQIVFAIIFLELAYGATDPSKEPGDVGGITWIRYDDPELKKFKLNAERNNGRAAMMGITGMITHNLL